MFKRFYVLSVLLIAVSFTLPTIAAERDVISMMSVKQRLERMERLVDSDIFRTQARRIDALQQEIAQLRDQLDQQGYELNSIKQRQRSLYVDLDRRINAVETAAPASGLAVPVPSSGSQVVAPKNARAIAASASAAVSDKAKAEYDAAFDLLKEGRYKPAITAFEDFLKSNPDSQYADNAQYWLAEASYANRQYQQALSEFQRLITDYPDSTKAQGARLKIAYVYYELKNWSAARESLQQIISLYPDTNLAKKANERLERIQREGH
ncbi:MAG: tol-pal system protein YbgF [Gammaproteobacteria bacterium]|jgi:tol-pal system protein YbgF|nr:tol-pal system protein YbgF [Gammaproteobacteria bacterium]